MLRAYLKIIFACLAVLCVALGVAVLFYFWENYIEPSRRARLEIAELDKVAPISVDLGVKEYDRALELLNSGDTAAARRKLTGLMSLYKDSVSYPEARRIIGEQNLDVLLSHEPMPGKIEYIVQRGDSLLRIAGKAKSTIQYIVQVNNLMGTMLRPGDQLVVAPLDFSVVVNLGEESLELRQNDRFFKEYHLSGYRMPPGPSSFDTTIKGKEAYDGAKLVRFGASKYVMADKYIRCKRPGISIRARKPAETADEFVTGIFLDAADVEELNTLLKTGMKVHVRK